MTTRRGDIDLFVVLLWSEALNYSRRKPPCLKANIYALRNYECGLNLAWMYHISLPFTVALTALERVYLLVLLPQRVKRI